MNEVTVHVASLNTRAVTELCIRSMRHHAGMPFDLVVGDCGSTDGSLEMLRAFERDGWLRLEVAPEGRRHPEWLDRWLAACPTRFCGFSDSDVEYRRHGWLRDLLTTAERTGAALVATRIQATGGVPYTNPVTGAQAVLCARPEPWLVLIDVERVRPVVTTSFGYTETRRPDGTLLAFDTMAAFFRDLDAAGLPIQHQQWWEMLALVAELAIRVVFNNGDAVFVGQRYHRLTPFQGERHPRWVLKVGK